LISDNVKPIFGNHSPVPGSAFPVEILDFDPSGWLMQNLINLSNQQNLRHNKFDTIPCDRLQSIAIVLNTGTRYRLPEPIRRTHVLVNDRHRRLSSFGGWSPSEAEATANKIRHQLSYYIRNINKFRASKSSTNSYQEQKMNIRHSSIFSFLVVLLSIIGMDSKNDVIIQLTAPSVSLAKKQGINAHSAIPMIEMEQAQFTAELSSLLKSYSLNKNARVTGDIGWTFKEVFNGFTLSTTPEIIDEISRLSYVKNVYQDERLQLTLTESVPIIHADQVNEKFAISGEGIIVGIIDTGID